MASTFTRFLAGSALVAGLALGGTALASAQDDGSTTTVPDTEATTPDADRGAERGDRQRPHGDCEHAEDGATGSGSGGATADTSAGTT